MKIHKRIPLIAYVLLTAGVLLLGAAAYQFAHSRGSARPSAGNNSAGEPAPSAQAPQPEEVANHRVPADQPRYLSIPALNIAQAMVVGLGTLPSGQVATPNNLFKVGWYDKSGLPGQDGTMFMFGHVSSWQANGIFYNLKKLKNGDKVTVTRGDDQTYTYRVVGSKTYPHDQVDMNEVLSPQEGTQALNLMTCAGKVIKDTNEFSERYVVFTTLDQ